MLTLIPSDFQAMIKPKSGTAQIPVKTIEIVTGGRGSGSLNVCDRTGSLSY